jgi:MFS family permease
MEEKNAEKVLTPTVVKLGLVSLFADISSEMLYPITPIFLTTVLGASMSSVGLIEGFAEAVASLLKAYSGAWSDRISRRTPFVAFGYFLSAAAKPLIGFSSAWTQVLLARGLDRTGKGLRTAPRDALLSEAVSVSLRGAAFGWHRAMDTLGAVIGPLLAILFLSVEGRNLRAIYYWALIPGLAAVGIALLVKEKRTAEKKHEPIGFFDFRSFSLPFKTYLASWALFSLANSSDVFLLMKAKTAGISLNEIILLYCGYNLAYSLFSPYFGGLSDRIGRKAVLISGLIVFAAVYIGFSLASRPWHFLVLFGVYGIYMAATDGVGKALAVDLIEPSRKATGLGALGAITGISTVIASTMAGVLWDHWDHLGSFYTLLYGAAGAILAMLVLLQVREKILRNNMPLGRASKWTKNATAPDYVENPGHTRCKGDGYLGPLTKWRIYCGRLQKRPPSLLLIAIASYVNLPRFSGHATG